MGVNPHDRADVMGVPRPDHLCHGGAPGGDLGNIICPRVVTASENIGRNRNFDQLVF